MKYYHRVGIIVLIGIVLILSRARATATAYTVQTDSTERIAPGSNKHTVDPHFALQTVNMFNAGNYLMLECQLNGKSAYFMVDTGASFTIINNKVSKFYGFQIVERKGQQTTGFGGSNTSLEIALGACLKLGDQTVTMSYLARDLSKIARLIERQANIRITGIIGTDLLNRLGVKINFGDKTLVLMHRPRQ